MTFARRIERKLRPRLRLRIQRWRTGWICSWLSPSSFCPCAGNGLFASRMLSSFWFAGRLRFPGVLGFYKGFQVGQTGAPEAAVLFDPGVDRAQGFGIELIDAVAAFAVLAHQVCPTQQAQMLGDSRPRN